MPGPLSRTDRVSGVVATPTTVAGTPVAITDLESKFGWAKGTWESNLLRTADANGNKDGKVSAAEVDAYLANPTDAQFLTSTAMDRITHDVGAATAVGKLAGWQAGVGKAADANHDGTLTAGELTGYVGTVKSGAGWLPDQKAAMFDSSVSDLTGEADLLKGSNIGGATLERNYMRIVEDETHRTANMVSYVLSAADQHQTLDAVKRKDNFHADKNYAGSATPSDYDSTGFDRGHQKPAEDSPTQEAMDETFLMTNMAPQTPNLNEQSWKYLEEATREMVAATGGKATIVTGSLYLDATGKPLPPDQIQYIGSNGQKRVAVPTHSFKTVMLQLPNGKTEAYAFILPNQKDMPTKAKDIQALLLKSRVSINQVERSLGGGATLYSGLSKGLQPLKGSANAPIPVPNPGQYPVAAMVFAPKGFARPAMNSPMSREQGLESKYDQIERLMAKIRG